MTEGIHEAAVTAWFAAEVPQAVAPLTFQRVVGGNSCLTYVVIDDLGERFVLRRPPLGHVLATAHDVAREHRVMSALQDTDVPVPRMLGVCTDLGVNDAPFFVMAFVDGVVLHSAADAMEKLPSDAARANAAASSVDVLIALHRVKVDEIGVGDLARRTGFLERQLKRWASQWESSKTRERPDMERLHQWLVANRPDEVGSGIIHGDYRLGNLLHDTTTGEVLAVLDWELCTLGAPLADLSYLIRSWEPDIVDAPLEMAPASVAPGFPPADYLASRYATATNVDVSELEYWVTFNAWRSAAILQGVYRRYIEGDMGAVPPDVDRYERRIESCVAAGLRAAGLA